MITERDTLTECARLLQQAGLALSLWFSVLVMLTLGLEPSRDVVVIGPAEGSLRALVGSDTRIAEVRPLTMKVRGMEKGFVRALYANGAWLVLPSRPGGCLSLAGRT